MTESKQRHRTLAEYLASPDVSQGAFASSLGISASYVSLIASGQRTPALPLALRIAAAAQIPIESLLPVKPAEPEATDAEVV